MLSKKNAASSHVPHRVTTGCGGNGVFGHISLCNDILLGDFYKKFLNKLIKEFMLAKLARINSQIRCSP
jgi:hypothetical protein